MKKVIIALLVFYTALSINALYAEPQLSRIDATSNRPAADSTSYFGIGLQTFPLPGLTIQARLGRGFVAQIGALPSTPRLVPGEAFAGARLMREVYRLSMMRFFASGGYALNLLMEPTADNAMEKRVNQYGFGSAGAEWVTNSGFGVSIEAIVTILGPRQFNSILLPSGLGIGLQYHF